MQRQQMCPLHDDVRSDLHDPTARVGFAFLQTLSSLTTADCIEAPRARPRFVGREFVRDGKVTLHP
jgi:hypothetical protein